jgi:hypothetical protein
MKCQRHRLRRLASIGLVILVWSVPPNTARAEPDPREIVERMAARYRSVKSEQETVQLLVIASPTQERFTLTDATRLVADGGRGVTHKRAVRYVLYADDREDRIRVSFQVPKDDAGTGFLVWRHREGQDDQWLYMPALKKVRRVPVSSTATFMGTNFLYEDVRELAGEHVGRYVYEYGGVAEIDGRTCDVVVAKPNPETSSAYARRTLWIDRERLFGLQVEYYDPQGTLWKRLRSSNVHEVAPSVFRADLNEMRDLQLNEATLLFSADRRVGGSIPTGLFNRDSLETQTVE